MRLSVWPSPEAPWEATLAVARHAEDNGWDGLWFADHFMPNTSDATAIGTPVLECWSVLAALAATTTRLRLGSLVAGNTYRHPAVLANLAATTDRISGGRLVLGIGAGWQENEHAAYGIDFSDMKGRMDRLEEACQVIRLLTTQERTTFPGQFYQLDEAPLAPKPIQDPLPLLVGGGGEQRTLRIAARYANEWNVWGSPDVFGQKSAVLDQRCEEIERDPTDITRSTQSMVIFPDPSKPAAAGASGLGKPRPMIAGSIEQMRDTVGAYVEAGCDELIIPDWNLGIRQRRLDSLDRFATEVAAEFRS